MKITRIVAILATTGCAAALALGVSAAAAQKPPDTQTAQLFAQVAGPDPGVFGTSLEGAAFDADGRFYFVDTTAPAGRPKLMSLDLTTRKVTDLYTDRRSMLNCIGFAPDGAVYLCDLRGRVVRFDPATHRLATTFDRVGGTRIVPDDLTIAPNGDMYVADYQGTPTHPTGRILLRTAAGKLSVALGGLAHPNGIVLTGQLDGVWVDEDLAGRLDHVGPQLSSPAATTPHIAVHTAAYLSLGSAAYADSLTTDGAGNVYLAVYGAGEVLEFDPDGRPIGRVTIPGAAPHVTHVAIQPGTRRAFVTASGPGGGYIYSFTALAAAPAGAPNGG